MIDSLTLINTVTGESILIDQDISEYVLTEADLGTVESTHNSYKYPNQIGVYYSSSTLETRDISIEGYVIGPSYYNIEENKDVLNRLINPLEEIQLVRGGYKLFFHPDTSIQYYPTVENNNEYMCKFLIQGTAAYPLFSTINDEVYPITMTIPQFKFPLIIPQNKGIIMGVRQRSLIAEINNIGDVETGIKFILTATGTAVNPSITEILTQKHIYIDKTLTAGEVIEISTEDGNKYVHGTVDLVTSNYFKYRRLNSDWIKMRRGNNVFQYDCDEGRENLDVTISYSPKYLEVD